TIFYELPIELQNARMKNIDINDKKRTKVIKWLKEFYDSYLKDKHQKGLYLHGSFGSGKTYLIIAMLNELAKKKVSIAAVYYPFLLRNLKESFSEDYKERIDYLLNVDILLLDDLGAENVTPWARDEILGTILQYRMDNNLTTFFTSNLTIEELEEHLSGKKGELDKVKARRIIERIKQLTTDLELISVNRRK
ncbi:MAG TPA: primosomal protein DnaI, partial [Bacilli bacterium]|nr:primosomal protein DnaI [Bacilli bacterium]